VFAENEVLCPGLDDAVVGLVPERAPA
jgi:hypothetical protein